MAAKRVVAVVPAAGLSTRFCGPNKLLQSWGASSVVGSVVATLRSCGLPTVLVTGRDGAAVAMSAGADFVVHNSAFEEGLGGSIACGVAACGEADGFLIALGDMPGVRAEVVLNLLNRFEGVADNSILAPVYSDEPERPGHPVLFGAAHRAALEGLTGDEGARSVVHANREDLLRVRVEGGLADVDSPDDLT